MAISPGLITSRPLERSDVARELVEEREQGAIDEDEAIFGVLRDVADLGRVEPEVQRVQHRARARDAEVELEVPVVVPRERGDAIAGARAEPRERARELRAAPVQLGVGAAVNRPIRRPAHDLGAWEERLRPLEKMREREREIHHPSSERSDVLH